MANPYFTSSTRLRVYQLLFLLNRSFHLIVNRLHDTESLGIFEPQDIKEMLGLVQEVQLEINTLVLDPFATIEDRDLAHFGRMRARMENRLKE
jgi:hypothetical protein